MKPKYKHERFHLFLGKSENVLKHLPSNSVHAVVCDPPYELGFMGKSWDSAGIAYNVDMWKEVLRVLKPGGHLLAFSGSRTYHRMTCAIEDAGFEIRDQIMWLYGSGFPKSQNVSKAIDKAAGAEREVIGKKMNYHSEGKRAGTGMNQHGVKDGSFSNPEQASLITAPATREAQEWDGWGTALKPSFEPLCVAMKPFDETDFRSFVNSGLLKLEARLWLLLSAIAVTKNFKSSQAELNAACAIAQWSVEKSINIRDVLLGAMDTSQLKSAVDTSLSIVSSWRSTLAVVSKHGSTSTTKTKFGLTIDWKILSFCLSKITPSTIIKVVTNLSENNANASIAVNYFNAEIKRLNSILELFALEPAISQVQENCRDVDEKVQHSPVCVARKPLAEKTVAKNVVKHRTGAMNIDASRIPLNGDYKSKPNGRPSLTGLGDNYNPAMANQADTVGRFPANVIHDGSDEVVRSFPTTQSGTGAVKRQSSKDKGGNTSAAYGKESRAAGTPIFTYGDKGSAARFFYCAKAAQKDRNEGLDKYVDLEFVVAPLQGKSWESAVSPVLLRVDMEHSPPKVIVAYGTPNNNATEWNTMLFGKITSDQYLKVIRSTIKTTINSTTKSEILSYLRHWITKENIQDASHGMELDTNPVVNAESHSLSAVITNEKVAYRLGASNAVLPMRLKINVKDAKSDHPTVKPTELMRYLVRLVTPPNGIVLDPFMGSGTTGKAAMLEGFKFAGIDMTPEYVEIAHARIKHAHNQGKK